MVMSCCCTFGRDALSHAPISRRDSRRWSQLLFQQIASERVATLDDALAVIKNGVGRNKVQFAE